MKIYIAHATNSDFQNELYNPIKENSFYTEHTIVLPHEKSDTLFDSKAFFQEGCDLVVAEVSNPSLGVGIELGWANIMNIPIICVYKNGSRVSNSIQAVTSTIIEYKDTQELISQINQFIK